MEKNEYRKMYEFENDYWWYRGLHELVKKYTLKIKQKQVSGTLRIFDAGCGTGRMMEILAPYGSVEGIDYSADAIDLCRERGLTHAIEGDLNTWESLENMFDVIISNDVICTSGVEDDIAVLKKFHSALKPGGYFISNFPAFFLLRRNHDIAVSGKRRYRRGKTIKILEEIGFKVERASYRLPHLFFFLLFQKYLIESFSSGKEVTSDLKPLPSWINNLFLFFNRFENRLFTSGFPFLVGSSLFIVAHKEESPQ